MQNQAGMTLVWQGRAARQGQRERARHDEGEIRQITVTVRAPTGDDPKGAITKVLDGGRGRRRSPSRTSRRRPAFALSTNKDCRAEVSRAVVEAKLDLLKLDTRAASSRTRSSVSSEEPMRATSIIYRRELGSYLRSPIAWVIAAVLLLVDGILFQAFAMQGEQLSAIVLERYLLLLERRRGRGGPAVVPPDLRGAAEPLDGAAQDLTGARHRDRARQVPRRADVPRARAAALVYMPILIKVNGKITCTQISSAISACSCSARRRSRSACSRQRADRPSSSRRRRGAAVHR